MVSAASAVSLLALFASTTAIQLLPSLDHNLVGAMTSAQAVQALLPLAAMGALLAAVASIYRQLHRRAAAEAAAGAGTVVAFAAICAAIGVIELFTFVCKPAAAEGYDGASARAREFRAAAALALPAAATATFFLGVVLLFVHVRAGGRAVAGEGHVQVLLVKIAFGATAVLVGLMAPAV